MVFKIKSFSRFNESKFQEVDIVNDMLLELSLMDINGTCKYSSFAPYRSYPSRQGDFLVITITKPVKRVHKFIRPSFNWQNIKDVVEGIHNYLLDEDWIWMTDKGTGSVDGLPYIVEKSRINSNYETKLEMWFELSN